MRNELIAILRCPDCGCGFCFERFEKAATGQEKTSTSGTTKRGHAPGDLTCEGCGHRVLVRDGIPRFVESDFAKNTLADKRSRDAFGLEWSLHRPADGTWGMNLEERTHWYFLAGVGLTPKEMTGLKVLDGGCGNGSSTLGIARLGAFCVGMDQSAGIERANEYFTEADKKLAVHYVQCNLLDAPFEPESFDVVFSAGVLHHLPNTRKGFDTLATLVKPGGHFYVWLYRHEKLVTPLVNTIRKLTTRLRPRTFFAIAVAMSPAFQLFTYVLRRLHLREYQPMTWRASALALMDIFGAPYAHAHTYEEVSLWYEEAGFDPPRLSSLERRGFSTCGIKKQNSRTERSIA